MNLYLVESLSIFNSSTSSCLLLQLARLAAVLLAERRLHARGLGLSSVLPRQALDVVFAVLGVLRGLAQLDVRVDLLGTRLERGLVHAPQHAPRLVGAPCSKVSGYSFFFSFFRGTVCVFMMKVTARRTFNGGAERAHLVLESRLLDDGDGLLH